MRHRHNFGAWRQEIRDYIYETDTHSFIDKKIYNVRSCLDETCGFVEEKKAGN